MDDRDRKDLWLAAFMVVAATVALIIEGEWDWGNLTPFLLPQPATLILGYAVSVLLIVRVIRRRDRRNE